MRQTSKATAVEKADVVVRKVKNSVPRRLRASGQVNGLNAWCRVPVLRLDRCGLGEGGGRALAKALRLNTTLTPVE